MRAKFTSELFVTICKRSMNQMPLIYKPLVQGQTVPEMLKATVYGRICQDIGGRYILRMYASS